MISTCLNAPAQPFTCCKIASWSLNSLLSISVYSLLTYIHLPPAPSACQKPLLLPQLRWIAMAYYPGYNTTIQHEIAEALIEAERSCTGPNATSIVS